MKIQQAIADGYKYCAEEDSGERLISLEHVMSSPIDYADKILHLCEKNARHMSLSDDEIATALVEQLENDDEFYNEDGCDYAIEGCDDLLKALSERIKSNLSKRFFYFTTNEIIDLSDLLTSRKA